MYRVKDRNYLLSIAQCYMNTSEANKRYLLGENPINMTYDFKETVFFESGLNMVNMDLCTVHSDFGEHLGIKNIVLSVDLKIFQNKDILHDYFKLEPQSSELGIGLIVTSNRDGLTSVEIPTYIKSITFKLQENERQSLVIKTNDCCIIETIV